MAGCGSAVEWPTLPDAPFWPGAPSEYSIGVMTAPTPFAVGGSVGQMDVPVLTASDIEEPATAYVADPFLIRVGGRWHMFYELLAAHPRLGCIAWAESDDGVAWEHRGIAIEEPFHLSYPYVFEWEGRHWMILESHQAAQIRLYRASEFPREWELESVLIEGAPFVDASVARHDGRWWLFVSTLPNRDLYLFHSEHLDRGWTRHPQSPVIRDDPTSARPAGRLIHYDGRLWRVAQNCRPRYGSAVRLFEVVTLTTEDYAEREHEASPLLQAGMVPWADLGMHHYDPQPFETGDRAWLIAVDGNWRAQPEIPLDVRFEDGSMLLGATRRPGVVRPGQTLLLRLYWKGLSEKDRPIAFVHFRRDGDLVFQADHELDERADQYDLYVPVPEDAPPGPVEITLGLYRRGGPRLKMRSDLPHRRNAVVFPFGVDILEAPKP